jgi:hypothetical protein
LIVVPRISWPLDRTLAGSSAFSFGSSAIPETTSWAGMAVEPADGEEPLALLAADPLALSELAAPLAAVEELLDELQPASTIAPATAMAAAAAGMRARRAGCLSGVTGSSFQIPVSWQVERGAPLAAGAGGRVGTAEGPER